jgi:hypothetical protein
MIMSHDYIFKGSKKQAGISSSSPIMVVTRKRVTDKLFMTFSNTVGQWCPTGSLWNCLQIIFLHSVVCLTTGPYPLPKRVLHRVRSSTSSFNFQYPLASLRPSSSCLHLFPRLPVISILPSNFHSITCFRRQFLRKMWPIEIAFLLFIVCRIFLSSLTL